MGKRINKGLKILYKEKPYIYNAFKKEGLLDFVEVPIKEHYRIPRKIKKRNKKRRGKPCLP